MRDTLDGEVVDLGTDGGANLTSGAGEVDRHTDWYNRVYDEVLGSELGRDCGDIGLRGTELLSKLSRREPLWKLGEVRS